MKKRSRKIALLMAFAFIMGMMPLAVSADDAADVAAALEGISMPETAMDNFELPIQVGDEDWLEHERQQGSSSSGRYGGGAEQSWGAYGGADSDGEQGECECGEEVPCDGAEGGVYGGVFAQREF